MRSHPYRCSAILAAAGLLAATPARAEWDRKEPPSTGPSSGTIAAVALVCAGVITGTILLLRASRSAPAKPAEGSPSPAEAPAGAGEAIPSPAPASAPAEPRPEPNEETRSGASPGDVLAVRPRPALATPGARLAAALLVLPRVGAREEAAPPVQHADPGAFLTVQF